MRRPRRVLRRPTGPAARIKNPLVQTRLENDLGPRVIERGPAGRLSPEELARRQRIIKEKEARFLARKLTLEQRNLNAQLKFPPPVFIPGEGKTCAIVGNASSIMTQQDGVLIDTHDIVVRINTPKIKSKESQGTRTNYLFVTSLTQSRLPRLQFPSYQVANITTHLADFFNELTAELREDIGDPKARPTTGFVAIVKMVELGYRVNLFGFDWFQTPSMTTVDINKGQVAGPWQHHHPEWERQQVELLLHPYEQP